VASLNAQSSAAYCSCAKALTAHDQRSTNFGRQPLGYGSGVEILTVGTKRRWHLRRSSSDGVATLQAIFFEDQRGARTAGAKVPTFSIRAQGPVI